jgi:hypothetical protein
MPRRRGLVRPSHGRGRLAKALHASPRGNVSALVHARRRSSDGGLRRVPHRRTACPQPSDLTRHQECHHLTGLSLAVAEGALAPPAEGPGDQTLLVADLDRTYRVHPALTAFVSDLAYEDRFQSAPGPERIAVDGWTSGLAVRFVEHTRASSAASEEARVVADLWRSLQDVGWVDASGM